MTEILLSVEALSVSYGAVHALDKVSLTVPRGQTISMVGANGAGKTSILRAISGLVPSQGIITFKGNDLGPVPVPVRVKQGLVHCPEGRLRVAGAQAELEGELLLGGLELYVRPEIAQSQADGEPPDLPHVV